MSNAIETSVLRADLPRTRVPTVYFIDDSATMREVIKIAFRRENINVVTCPDAATALSQFEQNMPDAVITDVIMPDKDGYEVCQYLKQDSRYNRIPVILMSGVVNKSVAEKAIAVKADELIRKPFQPQELIGRVRALLQSKSSDGVQSELRSAQPLSTIFTSGVSAPAAQDRSANRNQSGQQQSVKQPILATQYPAIQTQPNASSLTVPGEFAWPRALAEAMVKQPEGGSSAQSTSQLPPSSAQGNPEAAPVVRSSGANQTDVQRLRNEIMRLELLVKKLQTEMTIEKQYCAALELHIRTLQESP
ncbi:MAG TPA: response regulator [Candidatus Dormibacteraeota bacterium]|nr:response regulator [Candidatus Dormibacteraeota bacterium]